MIDRGLSIIILPWFYLPLYSFLAQWYQEYGAFQHNIATLFMCIVICYIMLTYTTLLLLVLTEHLTTDDICFKLKCNIHWSKTPTLNHSKLSGYTYSELDEYTLCIFRNIILATQNRSFCATEINDCTWNPCQFGGTCKDGVNSFKCTCQTGFSGEFCQISKLSAHNHPHHFYGPRFVLLLTDLFYCLHFFVS